MKGRDEKLAKWPRTKGEIRGHLADYYAMITHLDDQIGRVLKTLEQTHGSDDTIVVFAGDNGLAVGRHGLMGKQSLYEHSIGVPLIFRGPGIDKNRTSDAMCYLHDVFPTLCGLSGLNVPDSVESKSLAGILRNNGKDVYKTLGFAYRDIQRAFRDDRYKLIEYAVKGKRTTQLFDLQKDRDELNNLAADPAYAKKIKQLRSQLKQWQKQVGDTSDSFT
jgi:arylsulfatase A-like enzyme